MPRRNNPLVTLAMFLAVCGFGYAAYHFVAVEKVFEKKVVESPPGEETDRIRGIVDEGLVPDDCYEKVTGFGWRPNSQRYRVVVEIKDGCGNDAARRIAARAQDLVDRASNGKFEAEVQVMVLGRELYLSVP